MLEHRTGQPEAGSVLATRTFNHIIRTSEISTLRHLSTNIPYVSPTTSQNFLQWFVLH